jgi:chemotaxis protein CheZ
MSDNEALRRDLLGMVDELRSTLREIGEGPLPQTQLVTNARDRLRYIATLTEQAASQTLNAAETIGDQLRAQRAEAAALMKLTRSPRLHAFLERLQDEHADANSQLSEVIQAQAFQDLVGQVVNKLLDTMQRMEDSLAHLLIEDADEGPLSGPQVRQEEQFNQDDVDSLFG